MEINRQSQGPLFGKVSTQGSSTKNQIPSTSKNNQRSKKSENFNTLSANVTHNTTSPEQTDLDFPSEDQGLEAEESKDNEQTAASLHTLRYNMFTSLTLDSHVVQNPLFQACVRLGFKESLKFTRNGDVHALKDSSKQILTQWIKRNFLTIIVEEPFFFQEHSQIKITDLLDETFNEALDKQIKALIQNNKLECISKFIRNVFETFHLVELGPVLNVLSRNIAALPFELQMHLLKCSTNIEHSFAKNKTELENRELETLFDSQEIVGREIEVLWGRGQVYKGKIFSVNNGEVIVNYDDGTSKVYQDYMKTKTFNILKTSGPDVYEYSFGKLKTEEHINEIIELHRSGDLKGKQIQFWLNKRPIIGRFDRISNSNIMRIKCANSNIHEFNIEDTAFEVINQDGQHSRYVKRNEELREWLPYRFLNGLDTQVKLDHFLNLPLNQRHKSLLGYTPSLISMIEFNINKTSRQIFIDHLLEITDNTVLLRYVDGSAELLGLIPDDKDKKQFFEQLPLRLKIDVFNDLRSHDIDYVPIRNYGFIHDFMISDLLKLENYEKYPTNFEDAIIRHHHTMHRMSRDGSLNEESQKVLIEVFKKTHDITLINTMLCLNEEKADDLCISLIEGLISDNKLKKVIYNLDIRQHYKTLCRSSTILPRIIDFFNKRAHTKLLSQEYVELTFQFLDKIQEDNNQKLLNCFSDKILKAFVEKCSSKEDLERIYNLLENEKILKLISMFLKDNLDKTVELLSVLKQKDARLLNDCSNEILKIFIKHFTDIEDLAILVETLDWERLVFLIHLLNKKSPKIIYSLLQAIKETKPDLLKSLPYSSVKAFMRESINEPDFRNLFSEECLRAFMTDYLSENMITINQTTGEITDPLFQTNLQDFFTADTIDNLLNTLKTKDLNPQNTLGLLSNLMIIMNRLHLTTLLEDDGFQDTFASLLNQIDVNKFLSATKGHLKVNNNPKFIRFLISRSDIEFNDLNDFLDQDITNIDNFLDLCKWVYKKYGPNKFKEFTIVQSKYPLKIHIENIMSMAPPIADTLIQSGLVDLSRLDKTIDTVVDSNLAIFREIYQPNIDLSQLKKQSDGTFSYLIDQKEKSIYKLLNFQMNEKRDIGVWLPIDPQRFKNETPESIIQNYNNSLKRSEEPMIGTESIMAALKEVLADIRTINNAAEKLTMEEVTPTESFNIFNAIQAFFRNRNNTSVTKKVHLDDLVKQIFKAGKASVPFSFLQSNSLDEHYQTQVGKAIDILKRFKDEDITIETLTTLAPLPSLDELQNVYEEYLLAQEKIKRYSDYYHLNLNVDIIEFDGKLRLCVSEILDEGDSHSKEFEVFSHTDVGVLREEGPNYILENVDILDMLCELARHLPIETDLSTRTVEDYLKQLCESVKEFVKRKFDSLSPVQDIELQQYKTIKDIFSFVKSLFDQQQVMMTPLVIDGEKIMTIDDYYQLKFPMLSLSETASNSETTLEIRYLSFLQKLGIRGISNEESAKAFMVSKDIIREFDFEKVFETLYDMMDYSHKQLGVTKGKLKAYINKLERLKVVFKARQNQVNGTGQTGRPIIYSETYDGNPLVNAATRTMIDILVKLSDPKRYELTKESLDHFFSIYIFDVYISYEDINMNNLKGTESVAILGCAQGLGDRMKQLFEALKPQTQSTIDNRLRILFDQKVTGLQVHLGTNLNTTEGIGLASDIKKHLERYMQQSQDLSRYKLHIALMPYKHEIDSIFKISYFVTDVEEFYKEKFKEIKERALERTLYHNGVEESKASEPEPFSQIDQRSAAQGLGAEESKVNELDEPEIADAQVKLTEDDYLALLHPLFSDAPAKGESLRNFTDDMFLDSLFKIGTYFESHNEKDKVKYTLDEALFFKKLPLFIMNFFKRKHMLEFNIDELKRKAKRGDSESAYFLGSIYRKYNNHQEAVRWYKQAIRITDRKHDEAQRLIEELRIFKV